MVGASSWCYMYVSVQLLNAEMLSLCLTIRATSSNDYTSISSIKHNFTLLIPVHINAALRSSANDDVFEVSLCVFVVCVENVQRSLLQQPLHKAIFSSTIQLPTTDLCIASCSLMLLCLILCACTCVCVQDVDSVFAYSPQLISPPCSPSSTRSHAHTTTHTHPINLIHTTVPSITASHQHASHAATSTPTSSINTQRAHTDHAHTRHTHAHNTTPPSFSPSASSASPPLFTSGRRLSPGVDKSSGCNSN